MIEGGSNSLIVKTKVGSSNSISCISKTPNLQVQQLEYSVGFEATQHATVSTALPNIVEAHGMLNPKKRGSVEFEVNPPSKPKLLKTLHFVETFEPSHGCPTKNLHILEVNFDEDCDDLQMQEGCLDPKPFKNPHDHREFTSEVLLPNQPLLLNTLHYPKETLLSSVILSSTLMIF